MHPHSSHVCSNARVICAAFCEPLGAQVGRFCDLCNTGSARHHQLEQAGILAHGPTGQHVQCSGIADGRRLVFVFGLAGPKIALGKLHQPHFRELQVCSRRFCALADLQRKPAEDDEIGRRREAKVNIGAAGYAPGENTVEFPAASSGGCDAYVDGLPPDIARGLRTPRLPGPVNSDVILKMTWSIVVQEDRCSGQTPPMSKLEKAAAVMAGMA